MSNKNKKAYLVYFSPATRVVADEDATEQEIIEQAKQNFRQILENDYVDNVEPVVEDHLCPYDPENDD